MLIRLLRTTCRPYRKDPARRGRPAGGADHRGAHAADAQRRIIDKGVVKGDVGYIRSTGRMMVGFTLIQIVFAVGAVYFGGKVAMSFGRDLRKALFHQVTEFSTREVGAFGAPSLITRITNDVQQVQMLVVMAARWPSPRRSRWSSASSWPCARTSACRPCCS